MRHLLSLSLAWFAVGSALTAIVGHLIEAPQLASWLNEGVPMAMSTAVTFLSVAGSILIERRCRANCPHYEHGKTH